MVKKGPIPASAGASNSCLPAERLPILSGEEAYELGLRVFPDIIEFLETESGGTYRRKFGVQNLRRSSVKIIFPNVTHTTMDHYLTYPHYHMSVDGDGKAISVLSPGLERTATLVYQCSDSEQRNDHATIIIDEEFSIHIPIVCVINFGELPSDGTPISRRLAVENRGRRPGRWEIEYTGETRLTFDPGSGLIQPGQKEIITVELIPEIEGPISETARFVGEDMAPLSVRVVGKVTKSTLQMLEPTDRQPLRLVDFGAVYYGTRHQRGILLHNTGVRSICYSISWSPREAGQEVAVDLTQCHLAAYVEDPPEDVQITGRCDPPEHCFRVDPPFGKITAKGEQLLTVDFSPRAYPPDKGFSNVYQSPPRRDYRLFLTIEPSIADLEQNLAFGNVYLGVKATSLPVMFEFEPRQAHFPACHPHDRIKMPCQLVNQSKVLPLTFTFSHIAHFQASARKGILQPQETRQLHILCKPTQIGPLCRYILLDLLGVDTSLDGEAKPQSGDRLLVSSRLRVSTYSAPITPDQKPLFVPGITPLWGHHEVGLNTEALESNYEDAPVCSLAAARTNKHRWVRWASVSQHERSYLALPNDRTTSIKPYHGPSPIRTIFTGQPRYTYLDPQYQYTPDEWRMVLLNEARYQEYIDGCRMERWLRQLEERRALYGGQQNDKLLTRTATCLLGDEFSVLVRQWSTICSRERRRLLQLQARVDGPPVPGLNKMMEQSSDSHSSFEVVDKFDERPKTLATRKACQRELTCVEIAKVNISNKLLNFGEVAQNVWACRTLDVRNALDWHVLFRLHVDCKELENTCPTSVVVPPRSVVRLPVIFQCTTKRQYKRVIKYSINGISLDSVLVVATVVRMRLDISAKKLHFRCSDLNSVKPGVYQLVVVLRNSLNGVGEYRWRQQVADDQEHDSVFAVRPAHGVIDPYHSQRCVVTFRPTTRPRQVHAATFVCHVTGGDALTLAVTSDLGMPRLKLTTDRLQLESLPLFRVRRFTPWLYNTGPTDALFAVAEPRPHPGISVSPAEGCVPAGGAVALTVTLVPTSLFRFDCAVRIQVRDGLTLNLPVSGRVEAPDVAADCGALYFGGVHCGSSVSQVFHLENRTRIPASLELDLREHAEFTLSSVFESARESPVTEPAEHRYVVRVDEGQTVPIACRFSPRSLANHGFVLAPLLHAPDEVLALSSGRRASRATSSMANRLSHSKRGQSARAEPVVRLPSLKVIATALKQPVLLTPQTLTFQIGAALLEKCFKVTKRVLIANNMNKPVKVIINAKANACFQVGPRGDDAPPRGIIERQLAVGETLKLPITFATSFLYPTQPTTVRAHLPVYVDALDQPAVTLDIVADCAPTYITTTPRTLFMGAVPLGMTVSSDLHIVCHDYQQAEELSVSVSYIEVHPSGQDPPCVTWNFPATGQLCGGRESQVVLLVVNFSSTRPVSLSARLVISDTSGRTASVTLLASADNCLLTTYSFLSLHQEGYQGWLGAQSPAAAAARDADSGRRPEPSPSAVSSAEAPVSAPTPSPPSGQRTVGSRTSSPASERMEMLELPMDIVLPTGSTTEFPRFPTGGAVEEFYRVTYEAVRAWFANFGFPHTPFPYELDKHLPECMSHTRDFSSFSKDDKVQAQMWQTLGDSVIYLSNKKIPQYTVDGDGEPADDVGKVLACIRKNRAILEFLKKEGALLAHVRPEFLLSYDDFQVLLEIVEEIQGSMGISKVDMVVNGSGVSIDAGISARNMDNKESLKSLSSTVASLNDVAKHLLDPNIVLVYGAFQDRKQFQDVSKAAWMDTLLQIFRRFILQPVVQLSSASGWPGMSDDDAQGMPQVIAPDESNVYSVPERLLLTWMTWSYNSQMRELWEPDAVDQRTITNFDADLDDGVVLCCLFASYCSFLRDRLRAEVYARPSTPEQAFHNCVIVAETCSLLNLDARLDPAAVMDANPVAMILLCTMLYEKLPLYRPRDVIQFRPELGSSQVRQLSMRNTGGRTVAYEVKMLDAERGVFQVQGGSEIVIGPRRSLDVTVQCNVHRIKQYSATLLLCPKSAMTPRPRPLVYPLAGGPLGTSAPVTVEVVSPLYSCRQVTVDVPNPLKEAGSFTVHLTDRPQGDRDLDTWLHGGVDAFPVVALDGVQLKARGKSRVAVTHMPWAARGRDYYALFSNELAGDFIVCFRSSPSDPLPFAAVRPVHGWLGRVVQAKGGAVCSEPQAGATPLVVHTLKIGDADMLVGCRDRPQPELEAEARQSGPPPDGLGAIWMAQPDEVVCAHCHLVVDLAAKLRDFLEQCGPTWESDNERDRRALNGTLISSEMTQQFQTTKYVRTPTIQSASASKGSATHEPPEPPPGHVTYQVSSRNKDFTLSPRLVNVQGTPGPKSIPLCLTFTSAEVGWHVADIVLNSARFSDVITARIAVLVHETRTS